MHANELERTLLASLLQDWGYAVGSAGLRQAFGFPSQAALRLAITQGHLPVRVFSIPGRKGPFALAHEVAHWLATRPETLTLPLDTTLPSESE